MPRIEMTGERKETKGRRGVCSFPELHGRPHRPPTVRTGQTAARQESGAR